MATQSQVIFWLSLMGMLGLSEFGLMRISSFSRKIAELDGEPEVNSMTLEAQESLAEGDRFKPAENIPEEANEEDIDIFALGTIVRWIVEKVGNESGTGTNGWCGRSKHVPCGNFDRWLIPWKRCLGWGISVNMALFLLPDWKIRK